MGSREEVDNQSDGVRGPHGHCVMNETGKELMGFLLSHQATLCNMVHEEIYL